MMNEKELNQKQELINAIQDQLLNSSPEELEHVQHVLSSIDQSKKGGLYYFAEFLGIDWNHERAAMTLGMQHTNTYGVAQGGAIYTLADMAMGYKVLSKLPSDKRVYTIEMKMNYVSPGKGKRLVALPDVLHAGRKTAVVTCKVEDDNEKLVAQGLGTFYIK